MIREGPAGVEHHADMSALLVFRAESSSAQVRDRLAAPRALGVVDLDLHPRGVDVPVRSRRPL